MNEITQITINLLKVVLSFINAISEMIIHEKIITNTLN